MAKYEIPEKGQQWMTEEIRALLFAIQGAHAAKKRTTVIKLAFAKANQQVLKDVFGQEDTCAENIWYQKWQYVPVIRDAFEACYQRAMEWADEETISQEEHYRRQRRQSVARYAAQAPSALAAVMAGMEQRGADRISAADTLMRWAEPDTAAKVGRSQTAGSSDQTVNVNFLAELDDNELDQLIDNLQAADSGDAAGETAAAGSDDGPDAADVDDPTAEAAGAE